MKAWRNAVLFGGLAALAILLSLRPVAAAGERPSPERIDALVHDLGSPQFAVREKAERELTHLGIVTREALLRAVDAPDAEVRVRARAILAKVGQLDFEHRLEAFAADYDGSRKQTLPGWDQFSARFGAGRLSRVLFVEMERAEPELLEAMAEGTRQASESLADRAQQIVDGKQESLLGLGTWASIVFVGSAEGVTVNEQNSLNFFPFVVQTIYQENFKTVLWTGLLRKLVAGWITKEATPATVHQNLILAAQLDMKPEALDVARQLLSNEDRVASRPIAILIMGRFGDRSHVPILEKLLDDATICGMVPTQNPPHQVELQVRDIALAVVLHLTDQELREYGYRSAQPYAPTVYELISLSFADSETRETALRKWAQWRAQHPDP